MFVILQGSHLPKSRQPAELLTCVCQRATEMKSSRGMHAMTGMSLCQLATLTLVLLFIVIPTFVAVK
jgi:hypothetical protein